MSSTILTACTVLLLTTFATCSTGAGHGGEPPADGGEPADRAGLGEEVRLGVGEEVAMAGDGEEMSLTFVRVASDSRCPEGVDCIWEGDAEAVFEVEAGDQRSTVTLHTAPRYEQQASAGGYTLRLVKLDPYPREGQPIAPEDYVATVVMDEGEGGGAPTQ